MCEPAVWEDAHSDRTRGFVRLRLRHGTPLGVLYTICASGAAVPFVLERLSNTLARLEEAFSRTPDLSRSRPCVSSGMARSSARCTPYSSFARTPSRIRHALHQALYHIYSVQCES